MRTMTATEFARNLSRALDRVEHAAEEIVIVRNHHTVAKLVPGAPAMSAMEAFSDLYGILSDDEGSEWINDSNGSDRPLNKELRDQWA